MYKLGFSQPRCCSKDEGVSYAFVTRGDTQAMSCPYPAFAIFVGLAQTSAFFPCCVRFVCLFICLFRVGFSTDRTVYLKRSYAKGKKKKRKNSKGRKVIRLKCFQNKSANGSCLIQESQGVIKLFSCLIFDRDDYIYFFGHFYSAQVHSSFFSRWYLTLNVLAFSIFSPRKNDREEVLACSSSVHYTRLG